MSRTRHHDKVIGGNHEGRKKPSLRQKNFQGTPLGEWYIELPITKQIENRLSRREKAWG